MWNYLSVVGGGRTSIVGEDAKHNDCLDFNNVPIFKAVDILNFALVQCPRLAIELNSLSFSVTDVDYYAKDIDIRSEAVGDQIINEACICNLKEELAKVIMDATNTHLPGIQEIEIIDFCSKSFK